MGDQASTMQASSAALEDSERLVPMPALVSVAQKAAIGALARKRQLPVSAYVREVLREHLAAVGAVAA